MHLVVGSHRMPRPPRSTRDRFLQQSTESTRAEQQDIVSQVLHKGHSQL